jgi:precorrin-2 dehydrogenase/sirohydrochlorin ferrochelatase
MKFYPIFLRVAGRACLVIGGGTVAVQKVESLLNAGAAVTVISPELAPAIAALATAQRVTHHRRCYRGGDLHGFFLAYAATSDAQVHTEIAREAEAAGVLLNVVDTPQLCTFIVPSVMQRGDLLIATSTSGTSPALARRIRRDLEHSFGPEYDLALRLLGRLREAFRQRALPAAERQRIFGTLVDSPLIDYLRSGQRADVDRLLATTVGDGVSLETLGVELTA